tara:strand:+ start:4614 stop:5108 length:495 start_codon:yes stop_codon:yes gene_type:complete
MNKLQKNMRRFGTKNLNEQDLDSNNNGYPDEFESTSENNKFEEWLNSLSSANSPSKYQDSFPVRGGTTWGKLKQEMISAFNATGNADSVFKRYGMYRGTNNTYMIGGYVGDKVTLISTLGEFIQASTGMGTTSPKWDYSKNSGTSGTTYKNFSNQVYPPGSRMD